MRFVQSSDFHLHPDCPERLEALRAVADLAGAQEADALLIAGDLFHAREVAGALRVQVRSILETFPGTTLIIPGNHDQGAFPPEADYGQRTAVLARTPFEEHVLGGRDAAGVRIVGVPYQDGVTLGQLLAGLEVEDPLGAVLMAHGTYQGSWSFTLADGGEEVAYLPIEAGDLRGRFAYAALGHLHSRVTFQQGWTAREAWGYAGSPVAVTRGELGPRHAVVVDFEPGFGARDVRWQRLQTDYWEHLAVRAAPWEAPDGVVQRLGAELERLSADRDGRRGLRVRVQGWIEGDEAGFRRRVQEAVERVRDAHRAIECDVEARTVSAVTAERPEIADLLERVRRLGEDREADPATVEQAAGLVLEAAEGRA